MKEINIYITEKLKINKDTKLHSGISITVDLESAERDSAKKTLKDSLAWFNEIFRGLDENNIDKLFSLHSKALKQENEAADFDNYIKLIHTIDLRDYKNNDFGRWDCFRENINDTIKLVKEKINSAERWQDIYNIFWHTLVRFLENKSGTDSDYWSLKKYTGVDEALNLVFKAIISQK